MATIENLGIVISILMNGSFVKGYMDDEPDTADDQVGPRTATCHCRIRPSKGYRFRIVIALDMVSDGLARAWLSEWNPAGAFAIRFDVEGGASNECFLTRRFPEIKINGVVNLMTNTHKTLCFAQSAGRIRLSVHRVWLTGTDGPDQDAENGQGEVLGGGHGLVEARQVMQMKSREDPFIYRMGKGIRLDPIDKPLAVFYLKYRLPPRPGQLPYRLPDGLSSGPGGGETISNDQIMSSICVWKRTSRDEAE